MEVTRTHTYAAPLEAVLGLLQDHEALVAKYVDAGNREIHVLEMAVGEAFLRVRTTRIVDVDLPGFASRVLKPSNTTKQVDVWERRSDTTWEGTSSVEIEGAPVRINATMRLQGDSSGQTCTHSVTVSVAVKVPVVGGKIADFVGKKEVPKNIEGEFDFNDRWLETGIAS